MASIGVVKKVVVAPPMGAAIHWSISLGIQTGAYAPSTAEKNLKKIRLDPQRIVKKITKMPNKISGSFSNGEPCLLRNCRRLELPI